MKKKPANKEAEELHSELKEAKKEVLRVDRKGTHYLNKICENGISEMVKYCLNS